jgi:hypothetical protein
MCIPLHAVYRNVVCRYLLQAIFFSTYKNLKIGSLQKNEKKKEKKKCKKIEKKVEGEIKRRL